MRENPCKTGLFLLAWRTARSMAADQKGSAGAMDNSLLVSLSQQLAAYRSMDVIANNLANVSTPGFKREAANSRNISPRCAPAEGQTRHAIGQLRQGCRHHAAISARAISSDTGAPFDCRASTATAISRCRRRRACATPATAISRSTPTASSSPATAMPLQGDGGAITITPDDGDINIAHATAPSPASSTASPTRSASCKVVDFANDTRAHQARRQPLFHHPGAHPADQRHHAARACWKAPMSSR